MLGTDVKTEKQLEQLRDLLEWRKHPEEYCQGQIMALLGEVAHLRKLMADKDRLFIEGAERIAEAGACCTVAKNSELARAREAVQWLRGAVVRQMASDESIHGICSDDLAEALRQADLLTTQ